MLARWFLGNFLPCARYASEIAWNPPRSQWKPGVPGGAAVYFAVAFAPTNREIEIKLRVSDLPTTVTLLRKLGASSLGRVLERNILFDTPESGLRRAGCLLRLRLEIPAGSALIPPGRRRAVLTSKAPSPADKGASKAAKPRYKEKLERELAIPLPDVWPAKLRELGFLPGFRYEKYRTSFRLAGLHADLDETPVGTFLELEGAPRAIERVARGLGYSPGDYLRTTYWELYAAARKRKGRAAGNMVFDK